MTSERFSGIDRQRSFRWTTKKLALIGNSLPPGVAALCQPAARPAVPVRRQVFFVLLALVAFVPLQFTITPAAAQPSQAYSDSAAVPRIDGFDVEPVAQAIAGNELAFALYGSPGGTVAVHIDGARGSAVLVETEAGVYEGTYTIRRRDQITSASTATANLRLGNRVATVILDEPLVGSPFSGRQNPRERYADAPKINRFEVHTRGPLEPGEEVELVLVGTAGGSASARIGGVKGKLVLSEVRTGVYEGRYTITKRDPIAPDAVVTANLRVGERETNAVLGQRIVAASGRPPSAARSPRLCADCGVVEAINVVEVQGDGTYLGKIAGGVVGALLGSQVGSGRGTTVAEIAGAAGGVFAGNEIEKRMKTTKHYEVVVRLDNGGSRIVSYAIQPTFTTGTRVKVDNDTLAIIQ